MSLSLYNTLTRRLEPFEPLIPGRVGMYVCGVTVYDLCHIGHARSALVFEVVRRYLASSGYRVTLVRNFTDVDDKIIARAVGQGRSWQEVAAEFVAAYREDMGALGLAPADVEPRATEHIREMLALIQRLLAQGLAYVAGGDVYYAVRRFSAYGKLSHRSPDELLAGARVEVDERKRDPLDFALWKASKPGEPVWESPWGPGRPGWHIECSAMAAKYLGDSFDIHGGGEDLIFPHHENEIAQSEGASGRPLARYWLHNGFVTVNGEKMSKSLGNFVTIRQALQRFSPEALKLLLLSTNYRSPLDYTETAAAEKERALAGVRDFLRGVETLTAAAETPPSAGAEATGPEEAAFRVAMDDDFNTARATGALFDLVREGNRLLRESQQTEAATQHLPALQAAAHTLRRLGAVLALDLRSGLTLVERLSRLVPTRGAEAAANELARLLREPSTDGPVLQARLSQLVAELLVLREAARQARNWAVADGIRQALSAAAVRIDDSRTAAQGISEFSPERGLPPVAVTLLKS